MPSELWKCGLICISHFEEGYLSGHLGFEVEKWSLSTGMGQNMESPHWHRGGSANLTGFWGPRLAHSMGRVQIPSANGGSESVKRLMSTPQGQVASACFQRHTNL